MCDHVSVKMCATVLRKCARLFTALCPHCSCSDSHVPSVTSVVCDAVPVLLVTGRLCGESGRANQTPSPKESPPVLPPSPPQSRYSHQAILSIHRARSGSPPFWMCALRIGRGMRDLENYIPSSSLSPRSRRTISDRGLLAARANHQPKPRTSETPVNGRKSAIMQKWKNLAHSSENREEEKIGKLSLDGKPGPICAEK